MKKALLYALLFTPAVALAQSNTELNNICRIKGQEENTLRGIGLVVGLNGTGVTNDLATQRALSRAMELMGNPVSVTGRFDEQAREALRNVKNVTLAWVTATVPATGARRGDKLDCTVSAIQGKSLVGGQLAFAALQGPNTQDSTVFAVCEGQLNVVDLDQPTTAEIHNGCRMEQDIFTKFVSDDGWVTVVLDKHHADFIVAETVASAIAKSYADKYVTEKGVRDEDIRLRDVRSIDAANIRVRVPEENRPDPVPFVSELLEIQVYDAEPEARVICDTKTGSIAISGNVEIGDVVFAHSNLVVEAGASASFLPIAPGETNRPKLERLIDALSNLKVPTRDGIEIIKQIDQLGKLHAKLVVN